MIKSVKTILLSLFFTYASAMAEGQTMQEFSVDRLKPNLTTISFPPAHVSSIPEPIKLTLGNKKSSNSVIIDEIEIYDIYDTNRVPSQMFYSESVSCSRDSIWELKDLCHIEFSFERPTVGYFTGVVRIIWRFYNQQPQANKVLEIPINGSATGSFTRAPGFDSFVTATAAATDGSGDIYMGGSFTAYNGASNINRIVRLNANGSIDSSFNTGFGASAGFDNKVYAVVMAKDGSGDVYVGGSFTSYNGVPTNKIIRLNADGTLDSGFNIGSVPQAKFQENVTLAYVSSIAPAVDGSGDLYVGGIFATSEGGRVYFARLDADGTIDSAFQNPEEPLSRFGFSSGVVITPAIDGSGDVYVGGNFSRYSYPVGNIWRELVVQGIVRVNADGSVDEGFRCFGESGGFNNIVRAIAPATDGSGDVYVGGAFNRYQGVSRKGVVRLNQDGSIDPAFGPATNTATGFRRDIFAIAPTTDGSGDVYLGGWITQYQFHTVDGLLKVNADGTRDTTFNGFDTYPLLSRSVFSISLSLDGSGHIYVGGFFSFDHRGAMQNAARFSPLGEVD